MFAWNILCSVSTSPQLQLALGCSWCAAVTSWLLVTSAEAGYWSPQLQLELVTGLGCQQPGSPGHRGHMTALSLSAVTS